MAKVVADQRARGGGQGKPVLYVLIAALVLLGVYMVVLLSWSGMTSPTSPQQASSQQSNGSGASSSNTSKIPADNPAYPSQAEPKTGSAGTTPPR